MNADDPLLAQVPSRRKVAAVPKKLVWFAIRAENPVVREALAAGGTAYYVENGIIYEAAGEGRRKILEVAAIPLTFGGTATFQIANSMAAIAACRALGTGVAQIRAGLRSFSSGRDNPARANLYAVKGGYFLFDYGHNTRAIEAISETAANWPASIRTCIVGLPGDRADHILQEAAQAVARGFDRVIVREDCDLRGRAKGDAPRLVVEAIRRERPDVEVEVIEEEFAAMDRAVGRMQPGELVVAFCENCGGVRAYLERVGAIPASAFELEAATKPSADRSPGRARVA